MSVRLRYVLGIALAACVEGRHADELGAAHFGQSVAIRSADYVAAPGEVAAAGTPGSTGPQVGSSAGTAAPAAGPQGGIGGSGAPPAGGTGTAGASGSGADSTGPALTAGAGGAAGPGGASAPATAGTLTIAFTSVNQGGRYAPRNVGAVWIETGTGMFVKTLKRWAGIRANHLEHWDSVSGGWPPAFFGGGGSSLDQMDAVSGATLRAHAMHSVTWDFMDLQGQLVPDGTYKVGIEVTEDETRPGAWKAIEFVKGPGAQKVAPPDAPPFAGLTISQSP